ncbi:MULTISPECIES: hypothetical protein [Shewanella]|uniref:hypothetical protein n=1 Tax=Shewanella TaxID=22 RepID=UPI001AAF7C8B|nr:hypothetical protein [Shewanella algae]MBO2580274.1 hypothetical protein [Shewanella algae]HDS1207860.1 hypothetical protein [Shewanella algae]
MSVTNTDIQQLVAGAFLSRGFDLTSKFSDGMITAKAIGDGVAGELHDSGIVTVPAHAGGTYHVSELSEAGMSSKIRDSLAKSGIRFDNKFAWSDRMHRALAKGITTTILKQSIVSIPTDASGTFKLVGLTRGEVESALRAALSGEGFVLEGDYARAGDLAYAAAVGVTNGVNGKAQVSGSFTPGGNYKIE